MSGKNSNGYSREKDSAGNLSGQMPSVNAGKSERSLIDPLGVSQRHRPTQINSSLGAALKYKTGDIVDKTYLLKAPLGQGGMGVVFACKHLVLGKEYALKLLSGECVNSDLWTRFELEARALAKLNHKGIVSIHNMGLDQGRCLYYVMDLLHGETVAARLAREGRLSIKESLVLFYEVAQALFESHQHGIIHRDIKPSNIMIVEGDDKQEHIKLVDFGIARLSENTRSQVKTATGTVFGTPIYMSPEQCEGLRTDARSDIYSFGCALFEALSGSPPFCGANAFQTFDMHLNAQPPLLSDVFPPGNFSQSLEDALAKMLAKAPARRYQSMSEVMHDLERILGGKAILQAARRQSKVDLPALPDNSFVPPVESGKRKKLIIVALLTLFSLIIAVAVFLLRPEVKILSAATDKKARVYDVAEEFPSAEKLNSSKRLATSGPLDVAGATESEYDAMDNFFLLTYKPNERHFQRALNDYLKANRKAGKGYLTAAGFRFPDDIIIGAIDIGADNKSGANFQKSLNPPFANGLLPFKRGRDATYYLGTSLNEYPQVLEGFGEEDLTGINFVIVEPRRVINRISGWRRLKEISFFNPLIKAPPGQEEYDESPVGNWVLPFVDSMPGITSLGLCSPQTTGEAIVASTTLPRLQTLKLKRVSKLEPLMQKLPQLPNLKNLWLIDEGTTDADLGPLIGMKNLETLVIRRSKLSPDSLKYFKQMKHLKHLLLDCPWTQKEKIAFVKALPLCQFESIYEIEYLRLYRDGKEPAGVRTVK